jgi:hypothetical protein
MSDRLLARKARSRRSKNNLVQCRSSVSGTNATSRIGPRCVPKNGDACSAARIGYPVAQENDAERAARAAFSIQRALAELNRKNADSGKPTLNARIGIETGPVMVDAGEIYGDTPNTAAQVSHALAAFLSDIASAAVQSRCRMRITQAAYSPSASATATRGLRQGELGAGDCPKNRGTLLVCTLGRRLGGLLFRGTAINHNICAPLRQFV